MEDQPLFEPSPPSTSRRAWVRLFVRHVGRVLAVSVVGAALYAAAVGPRNITGLANGLFIAGAVLLLISLFPLVSEVFGRATLPFRANRQNLSQLLQDEQDRARQQDMLTYVFGVSGIIVVALSFAAAALS